jgi:hypothetical protein
MIIVPSWQDSDLIDRDVKTADNKDLGDAKEVNQSFLVVRKGDTVIRVPRAAIATFYDGKVYLRAIEAEVLSGIYPFLNSDTMDWQSSSKNNNNQTNTTGRDVAPAVSQTP